MSHCIPHQHCSLVILKDKKVARVWWSFCNQDHQSSNCNVVTSPESRKQILMKEEREVFSLSKDRIPVA